MFLTFYSKMCFYHSPFKVLIFVVVVSCMLKPSIQTAGIKANIHKRLQSVEFIEKGKRCPMYSSSCNLPILIKDAVDETHLNVTTNSTKFYKFLKIESCKDEKKYFLKDADCQFNKVVLNSNKFKNYTLIYAIFEPIVVGKGGFSVDFTENNEAFENHLVIIQPQRVIDFVHRYFILFFQIVISTSMGLLLDMNTILKIIKMPKPVLIGFVMQYTCMPLLAFACIKIFKFPAVEALSLFIYGCSPGGSGSNNWTILLNGDIDLSAIMTFVSTMGSLIFMPAWLYTLGRIFTDATNINIPFLRLLINLFTTIGPCLFGLLLSKLFPKLKAFILKIAKPFLLIFLLSFLSFTIYVKFYVFSLVPWKQWATAPFVPWLGFLLGGIVAWLFRLPMKQVVTIALETGIQNVGIAFLVITYNFPSPESDYGILPLISVSFLTTIPLWLILLILSIKRKIRAYLDKNKKTTVNDAEDEELKNEKLLAEKSEKH